MEVRFADAVGIIKKIRNTSKYLKHREKIISNTFFFIAIIICFVYLMYRIALKSIYLYEFFLYIFLVVIAFFLLFTILVRRKYFFLPKELFIRAKLVNGGLSLRTSELENIFILYIPKIFSKKIISSITFLSGGVFESGFIYEEIKGMERLYGHGNCYLFSTLFYSLSPKYQKYASLDLKKKLKNNRIKNPGITPLIRKFKPSWLKSREDLIKSYDIYIFEHKGKTYYALDIVFDKDLVENKTKEVYDLFVKIAKAIQ